MLVCNLPKKRVDNLTVQLIGQSGIPAMINMYGFYKLIILFCFIVLLQPIKAQNFAEFDTKTYQLYLEKDWDELIHTGKAALKQDNDYYYLRMRIGIAFYEKKNYKSSQSHFRKALEFNDGDPVASEYLYYAYLFGGQTQQAALLHENFTASQKKKIPSPDHNAVDRISVEYLYNKTNTDELVNDPANFDGLPYGFQIITRNFQNLNLSLSHHMHPGISFRHAYTFLGKNNFYYYDDGTGSFGVDGQEIRQHQYYISPSFTTRKGMVISPSFHFLHVGYQVPYRVAGSPGPGAGNGIAYENDFVNQMAVGLNLARHTGPIKIHFAGLYSNLNNTNQLTGTAGITWYPLGNLDFYLGGNINAHIEDLDKSEPTLIPDIIFGYGIASKVWIEITAAAGNMKNYTESNGYIVYNGLDWMKYKVLGNLVVPITDKGSAIYAGVRFARYESNMNSIDPALSDTQINTINYNSISIFGGLSWKL